MSAIAVQTPLATTATPAVSPHILELDGVRGIAILLVLVCHFGYLFPNPVGNWLSLGWVGVDLFFVLSGYLITRILLNARGSESYFRNFYARRALRIFPLYFLFLGTYFFGLLPLAHRHGLILDRGISDQAWFWSYLANWHTASKHSTLTHLWSLAIEEQFYLVWPTIVAFVPIRRLRLVCVGLALSSAVLRTTLILHAGFGREASFFTICRVEPIAMGALLALGATLPRPRLLASASILIVLVSLARGGPNAAAMTVAGVSAVAILFALFLQSVVLPSRAASLCRRLLRSTVLVSFGKFSYAIYLLHVLLLTVAVHLHEARGWPAIPLFIAGVALSFGLGWLSWNLLEGRILLLKRYFA